MMSDDDSNVLIEQISEYYRNNQYDGPTASAVYNKFIAQNYPDSAAAKIPVGVKFGGLTLDQIVRRDLKFNYTDAPNYRK
ncbi:hypothetical protein ACHAPU_009067 [Fusarium lateritium]